MRNLDRLNNNNGFTMVEVIVASIIVAFVAAGVWGVYWSVVNTYYVEQKGVNLETQGERILDLIANGGYFKDKRIYGLISSVPYKDETNTYLHPDARIYPRVGRRENTSEDFSYFDFTCGSDDWEKDCSNADEGCDYRIAFCLDSVGTNRRFAEFVVKFDRTHGVTGPPCNDECFTYNSNCASCDSLATAKLYFRLRTDGNTDCPSDYNYEVLISENILPRISGTDPDAYGSYDETWFKAQLLPKDLSSNYYSGVKVSFYLVDITQPILYNYRLDRELTTPISDPEQRRSFMGGIPYPKYFSTTIYFPNRE